MSSSEDYLDEIVANLKEGRRQWRRVDKLLGAFGYVRRRQTAINKVNEDIAARGLRTVTPLTTSTPLDKAVTFRLLDDESGDAPPEERQVAEEASEQEQEAASVEAPYVPIKIENLLPDTNPEYVLETDSIEVAVTKLELGQNSHLVVQDGHSEVRGIISFRSILRGMLDGAAQLVKDCTEIVPQVGPDTPLDQVLPQFLEQEAIIVLDGPQELRGLVTLTDLAREFRSVAEPFLIIGEIESRLRWIIQHRDVDVKEVLAKSPEYSRSQDYSPIDLSMGDMQSVRSFQLCH